MFEMMVDSVRVTPDRGPVVLLRGKEVERFIPVWVGKNEAYSIAACLNEEARPRLVTHDLIFNVIRDLDAAIQRVLITGRDDDTLMARIVIGLRRRVINIDSRLCDALALAVRAGAPVYAEPDVLDEVSLPITE